MPMTEFYEHALLIAEEDETAATELRKLRQTLEGVGDGRR